VSIPVPQTTTRPLTWHLARNSARDRFLWADNAIDDGLLESLALPGFDVNGVVHFRKLRNPSCCAAARPPRVSHSSIRPVQVRKHHHLHRPLPEHRRTRPRDVEAASALPANLAADSALVRSLE